MRTLRIAGRADAVTEHLIELVVMLFLRFFCVLCGNADDLLWCLRARTMSRGVLTQAILQRLRHPRRGQRARLCTRE